jgi:tripartite-type tricarboxylate transporter receptor subunit TctC
VLQTPEMTKALADMGVDAAPQGPAEFEAFIRDEMARFAKATRPLGTPQQ